MKKVIASLICLALAAVAFAKEMYAGLSLGYSFWAPEISDVYFESNCFEASPVFGIFPIDGNEIFAIEGSVDLNFGGTDDYSTSVIVPKVLAKAYFPGTLFAKKSKVAAKLYPYAAFGFSIPIQTVSVRKNSETNAGFNINSQIGCLYKFNDKILITADLNSALLKPWNWSIKAGTCYKIK